MSLKDNRRNVDSYAQINFENTMVVKTTLRGFKNINDLK